MFSKQTCKCWVWPTPTFTRGLLLILRAGKILFFPLVSVFKDWGWDEGRRAEPLTWLPGLSCCSVCQSRPTLCVPTDCSKPGCPSPSPWACSNSHPLSQWCHFVLCRPLLLLPSDFSSIRVFSNELALPFWWPKYWLFSFSIRPSSEYSGLISLPGIWGEKQIWFGALDLGLPVYLVFLWNVLCSWAAEAGLQAEIVSPLYTLEAWMWKYPHAGGRVVR